MCREVVSYGLKADFAGLSIPPPESGIGASPETEGL